MSVTVTEKLLLDTCRWPKGQFGLKIYRHGAPAPALHFSVATGTFQHKTDACAFQQLLVLIFGVSNAATDTKRPAQSDNLRYTNRSKGMLLCKESASG
jgi:hypothetical protein